jgi:hypothetical protein
MDADFQLLKKRFMNIREILSILLGEKQPVLVPVPSSNNDQTR